MTGDKIAFSGFIKNTFGRLGRNEIRWSKAREKVNKRWLISKKDEQERWHGGEQRITWQREREREREREKERERGIGGQREGRRDTREQDLNHETVREWSDQAVEG